MRGARDRGTMESSNTTPTKAAHEWTVASDKVSPLTSALLSDSHSKITSKQILTVSLLLVRTYNRLSLQQDRL